MKEKELVEKEKEMLAKKEISKPNVKELRGIDSSSSEEDSDEDSSETLSESEDDIEEAEDNSGDDGKTIVTRSGKAIAQSKTSNKKKDEETKDI